jgi:protein-tyrosine phosphatase
MSNILSNTFLSDDLNVIDILQDFNKVGDNLWQGAYPDEKVDARFKWIVNLAASANKHHYDVNWRQTMIATHFEDCAVIPEANFLYGLADLVNKLRESGDVLVHCEAGLNRSGLICALALMRKEKMSAVEAIAQLRAKRNSSVLFNNVFRKWLETHDVTQLKRKPRFKSTI